VVSLSAERRPVKGLWLQPLGTLPSAETVAGALGVTRSDDRSDGGGAEDEVVHEVSAGATPVNVGLLRTANGELRARGVPRALVRSSQVAVSSAPLRERAVVTQTTLPGNKTRMTEGERAVLARWLERGTTVP
jgi:hypothetical protein